MASWKRRALEAEAKLGRLAELYDPLRIGRVTGRTGWQSYTDPQQVADLAAYVEIRTARTREILGIEDHHHVPDERTVAAAPLDY